MEFVNRYILARSGDALIQRGGKKILIPLASRERLMNRYLAIFFVVLGTTGCTSVQYNGTDCGTLPSDTFWSGNIALQCQEYRRLQAETVYRTEVAQMLKQYRECVTKQESSPSGNKERCSVYAQGFPNPPTGQPPSK